ncbi:hypothetical protein SLEP1_g44321 [Rubroshorea leprosula]|uniref:Reverse transcriptase zinc-binding domain-containing protein n=1 Tax=Rubroshorea leprosula TaxID=152421 RepID=A0AAV5LFU3_9ROSI|nr:hypothetical protein SLEP1_g44321 [Rubroshorea leprosula]
MEDQVPYFNFLLTLLFFIVMVWRIWRKSVNHGCSSKLPPGPRKLPLIGNLHNFVGILPHHCLRNLAKKYGPIMHLQLGEVSTFVISSIETAKDVMKTHDLIFASRPSFPSLKLLTHNFTNIELAPYGDYWRQVRKICTTELLNPMRVRSFKTIREEELLHLIHAMRPKSRRLHHKVDEILENIIMEHRAKRATGWTEADDLVYILLDLQDHGELEIPLTTDNIKAVIMDLFSGGGDSSNTVLEWAMAEMLKNPIWEEEDAKELKRMIENVTITPGQPDKWEWIHSINGHYSTKTAYLMLVKQRRELEEAELFKRIWSKILPSKVAAFNWKVMLDRIPTKTNLLKRGIAKDTEDTKCVLCENEDEDSNHLFLNCSIARSMDHKLTDLRRMGLHMELIYLVSMDGPKWKGVPEFEGLHELKYLNLVIKETLRLHPAAPLLAPRESRERCEIDGYEIPEKSRVVINAWAIGRDPKYWTEADKFFPNRFLDSTADYKGSNYEFIPFGAGRRMCPGISFATATIELAVANLLYHFDWKLPDGKTSEDLDMTEVFSTVGRKKIDLCVIPILIIPQIE